MKEAMEYASSDPTRDPLLEEVVEYILKKVERLRAKEGTA